MSLPKAKSRKLIKEKDFVKNAKKVQKIFEAEAKYLREKKMKYGDNISSHTYPLS